MLKQCTSLQTCQYGYAAAQLEDVKSIYRGIERQSVQKIENKAVFYVSSEVIDTYLLCIAKPFSFLWYYDAARTTGISSCDISAASNIHIEY